jgi:membrane fusion protein (multidrug efflux system)
MLNKLQSYPRKFIAIAVVLFVSIGGLAYKFWPSSEPPPMQEKLVEVIIAKPTELSQNIRLIGRVRAAKQTEFVAEEKGILRKPYVQEGEFVKANTVLVELHNDAEKHNVKHAEHQVTLAKSDYHRQQKLANNQTVSKKSLERAQAIMLKAQVEYENALIHLRRKQIIAPFDGVCGVFKVGAGEAVKDGTAIISFFDISEAEIYIDVPASIVRYLKPDQDININGNKGKITSVQFMIDPATGMSLAKATMTSKDQLPCFGEVVDVDVTVQFKGNVIALPTSAIVNKGKQLLVYKVIKGEAQIAPVKTGLLNKEKVEILDGVATGDTVILRGQENLWPTRKVKPVDIAAKE